MKSFLRTVLRELAYGGMLMGPFWHARVLQELKIDRAANERPRSTTAHFPTR